MGLTLFLGNLWRYVYMTVGTRSAVMVQTPDRF